MVIGIEVVEIFSNWNMSNGHQFARKELLLNIFAGKDQRLYRILHKDLPSVIFIIHTSKFYTLFL